MSLSVGSSHPQRYLGHWEERSLKNLMTVLSKRMNPAKSERLPRRLSLIVEVRVIDCQPASVLLGATNIRVTRSNSIHSIYRAKWRFTKVQCFPSQKSRRRNINENSEAMEPVGYGKPPAKSRFQPRTVWQLKRQAQGKPQCHNPVDQDFARKGGDHRKREPKDNH
jgi:hypothetical protein